MRHRPINLIRKDTVKKLLALLERTTLLITVDSGPAHITAAGRTPVIGLHAASNPERSPSRQRIHLAGFGKNAPELMAACDVFVLASIKREGLTRGPRSKRWPTARRRS